MIAVDESYEEILIIYFFKHMLVNCVHLPSRQSDLTFVLLILVNMFKKKNDNIVNIS